MTSGTGFSASSSSQGTTSPATGVWNACAGPDEAQHAQAADCGPAAEHERAPGKLR